MRAISRWIFKALFVALQVRLNSYSSLLGSRAMRAITRRIFSALVVGAGATEQLLQPAGEQGL
jgi:hypothetical protein